MQSYLVNIEDATKLNTDYRRVLYTTHRMQLVIMSLKPGEEIGRERHGLDQFIRIAQGNGKSVLDGVEQAIDADDAIVIPAGTWHNVLNTSATEDMKLYTLYAPPEHKHGTVHTTKSDEDEEHFDGVTSMDDAGK